MYPSASGTAHQGRAGRVAIAALAAVWLILVLVVDLATGPAVRLGGLYARAAGAVERQEAEEAAQALEELASAQAALMVG